ncbi:MAG TPA: hypothetical protein VI522_03350, partial [Gammaproteobacteria bacterium]|nr:hypothetical protein [Gammaproteobacteria bacterium]
MLINFRPTNFDYAKYEALSNLDKMRFDANLIYYRLYMWYATRFIGTKFFNRILAPKLDSLTPKNRQICLADMEHVVRGLYSLMAVYTEFLLPQTRAPLNEKFAAIDALAELSDILYAEVGMFLYADHQDKFQVHKPSLDSRAYYFPNEPEDIEFDLQAGFAYFYDFILGAREHTPTPIMISYRNDGAGKGAVFDHAVFQHIAHRDTVILTDGKLPPLINTALMHEDLPALSYGVDTDKDPYKRPLQLDELGLFA